MAQSLREKRDIIIAWLSEKYGEDCVPPFEINERTVNVLHELATTNQAHDAAVAVVIKDNERKAKEYTQEGMTAALRDE